MNILSLENVSKNYGFRPLFKDVTLGLEDRDKIGIIGANGSGKATLFESRGRVVFLPFPTKPLS
jgi:ATP-binding cassette subfamily F protein uup